MRFYLTAVSVNWGRGYDPGQFRRNVRRVLRHVNDEEHVVLFVQELDEEPDPAHEHMVFGSMLEPGSKRVFWRTREPIILSPTFKVSRRRRTVTMGSGEEIGGPRGTGPRRYSITCVGEYRGIQLGFGNTHPHRRGVSPKVEAARDMGQDVFGAELQGVRRSNGGISGIWGGDMNALYVPRLVPGEKVAMRKGLDHLRYWEHPSGATLILKDKGSLNGTIDPHDPIWARWQVIGKEAA